MLYKRIFLALRKLQFPTSRNGLWYAMDRKVSWPKSRSGRCAVNKNSLPLHRIEPQFSRLPVHSPVPVLNGITQMGKEKKKYIAFKYGIWCERWTKQQLSLNMDGSIINLYGLPTMNSTVNNWVLLIKLEAFRKRLTTDRDRIFKDRSQEIKNENKLSTNFNFRILLYILE